MTDTLARTRAFQVASLLVSLLLAGGVQAQQASAPAAASGSATEHASGASPPNPMSAPASTTSSPGTERPGRPPLSSYYFDPRVLDLGRLLPPAPKDDSEITRNEIALMLKIQAERTPAQAERAVGDAAATIFRFADAIGHPEAFNATRLPKLDALVRKVTYEEGAVVQASKRSFNRPRPFVLEPKIEPIVAKPGNASYPSGHTMWARTMGLLLSDMLPEHREKIMARADEYAFNRVVAGVHYPSDVESGKLAATALAAFLMASPTFQADFAEAKKELRDALKLPTLH